MSEPELTQAVSDRSQWRCEEGGPAFETSVRFVIWLQDPTRDVAYGKAMTTHVSWPNWQRLVDSPTTDELQAMGELTHVSQRVRYPADGMAYVYFHITHPDQDEVYFITEASRAWVHVFTLLLMDGEWKVHQLGEELPPADLGVEAYSW
jgi:hypothetical protein